MSPTQDRNHDEIDTADLHGPDAGAQEPEVATAAAAEAGADEEPLPEVEGQDRLESILESLVFVADRPLTLADLKRLTGTRDGKTITAALEALHAHYGERGVQLVQVAGGWAFRTHPANAAWAARLQAGRPQRLTRAMLETMAIVAYRQPITRPEIDEIRGVDSGPVLKTLLERGLVRIIGKKEEVGRPLLYGSTPEFLRTFNLGELSELPTLREFLELSAADQARVDAEAPEAADGLPPPLSNETMAGDPDEDDELVNEIEAATKAAAAAGKPLEREQAAEAQAAAEAPSE